MSDLSGTQAQRPLAIVIGSGFGGLAAALRLLAKGFRVRVFEKLDAPGGRAYVYRQNGFTFDAGPTVITAPFLFEELWQLFGKSLSQDVQLVPVSPFYRVRFDDGSFFDYSGDEQAMREEVRRVCADDLEGYERFLQVSQDIFKTGFEELAHVPFSTWSDMGKVLPDILRLQGYRSVYSLVCKYVKHPKLRIVLSFHPLLVGGNPFSTTSIYCLIAYLERRWGVHFALGGTGSLVQGMVKLLTEQGGQLHLNSEVDQILVAQGKACGVRLHSGESVAADLVVSNADSAFTYKKLLRHIARKRWHDRRLAHSKYSMSLFVWYFGTNKQYPKVAHHSILLGPRYKGLLSDIFNQHQLAKDFSLYLHRPTATDTSLAPEGCDAFYVLSPVPHLQSGTNWATQAESYRQAIQAHLEKTVLPDLGKNLAASIMLTPQDFQDRLNSVQGAAFGLAPILRQSAWFRPHNQSEELENLFLVGAGTHPGAGLPGVLSSAKVLEQLIPDAIAWSQKQALNYAK